MKVLLTGFEPFGRWSINSSWSAVERLLCDATAAERRRLAAARLPVDHMAAVQALQTAIDAERPHALLAVGLAAGARLRVELSARAPAPSGLSDAPMRRPADWPRPHALVRRLRSAGHPAVASRNAGRFVCETVYRAALDRRAAGGGLRRVLFLHVPPLSSAWTPRRLTACLRVALATLEA